MTKVTCLNPHYVVQDLKRYDERVDELVYYQSEYSPELTTERARDENGEATPVREMMKESKKYALLFTSLHAAARVAASEGAHIRVLTNDNEMKEFGR